jgi:hypothetical protein
MLGPVAIGEAVDCTRKPWVAFYIRGVGVVASGALTIEEAATADYAGLWSPIGAVFNANTVSGDKELVVRLTVGAYAFVRLRASTAIVGTVEIRAAGIDAQ